MPATLGEVTKTLFHKTESHKLFSEFEVAATKSVKKGQPVILSGDNKVEAMGTSSTTQQVIGIAMHDGDAGDLITVMMKAYAIIFAEVETDALAAGPVRIGTTDPYNATTGYVLIDDASVTGANQIGWALQGGDDGDIVMLALL